MHAERAFGRAKSLRPVDIIAVYTKVRWRSQATDAFETELHPHGWYGVGNGTASPAAERMPGVNSSLGRRLPHTLPISRLKAAGDGWVSD